MSLHTNMSPANFTVSRARRVCQVKALLEAGAPACVSTLPGRREACTPLMLAHAWEPHSQGCLV